MIHSIKAYQLMGGDIIIVKPGSGRHRGVDGDCGLLAVKTTRHWNDFDVVFVDGFDLGQDEAWAFVAPSQPLEVMRRG